MGRDVVSANFYARRRNLPKQTSFKPQPQKALESQSNLPAPVQAANYGTYSYAAPAVQGYGQYTDGLPATYAGYYPSASAQTVYPVMDYSQYANQGYSYPTGYTDPYAQQQQYQPTPPQIRNPFAPPPPPKQSFGTQNAGFDPEYEAQLAQWQSAYAPQDQQEKARKNDRGRYDKGDNPNLAPVGPRAPAQVSIDSANAKVAANAPQEEKKVTVVRKGGGTTWTDDSLTQWDPTQFRIMVGNLAGEVTDDSLAKAFAQYGVSKARVVRDKRTTKSKGFGFVSFTDGEQGFKAAREMLGKYIGSHPVTIQRSKTDLRPTTQKDNHKNKGKNNRNRDKGGKKDDPLAANTGAHIEKKPMRNPNYKVIG